MPPPRTKSQQLEHERVVSDALVEYRRLALADDADNNNTSGSNERSPTTDTYSHSPSPPPERRRTVIVRIGRPTLVIVPVIVRTVTSPNTPPIVRRRRR